MIGRTDSLSGAEELGAEELLQAIAREVSLGAPLGRLEAELEGLCRGELSNEAQRDLFARAKGDPELARALRAYQPLEGDEQEHLVSAVVQVLGSAPVERNGNVRSAAAPVLRSPALGGVRIRGKGLAPRWNSAATAVWSSGLAMAAGVVLWLGLSRGGPQVGLGEYSLTLRPQVSSHRGMEGPTEGQQPSVVLFDPSRSAELVLKPQVASGTSVLARVLLVTGSEVRLLEADQELENGAVRLTLPVRELERLPQSGRLVVVLSSTSEGLAQAQVTVGAAPSRGGQWQTFAVPFEKAASSQ